MASIAHGRRHPALHGLLIPLLEASAALEHQQQLTPHPIDLSTTNPGFYNTDKGLEEAQCFARIL